MNTIIVFSAPSGSGKTTVINHLLDKFKELEFSVSATSRIPRQHERDGVQYYFLSTEEFKNRIEKGEFIEWEEVYDGTMYGTPLSEVSRIGNNNKVAVFDIDVAGALNLKAKFNSAFLIFVMPPSLEILKERLQKRASEAPEFVKKRLEKAEHEISHAEKFDYILHNDNLEQALNNAETVVGDFLKKIRSNP